MKKHYRKEKNCLNCGTILEGKFCHNCGQENLQIKESFGQVITHAVSDYFHFDHKFLHTLKPLLFKPGKLTNEYMAGKRVQFLHPVKMYIFISIVYFLLPLQTGHDIVKITNTNNPTPALAAEAIRTTNKNSFLTDKEKQKIKNTIKASVRPVKKDTIQNPEEEDNSFENAFLEIFTDKANTVQYASYEEYLQEQQKLPKNKRDNFWDRYIMKKYITWQHDGVNSKKQFTEGVRHNIPKMMFILLPLFALILKITFWRNRKFYVEHLIFSFHFHCFLFLFLTIIKLAEMAVPSSWNIIGWVDFFTFIAIVWYIYRSLRTVYNRSRFRTVTKMTGMSFTYFFMFCISITILAFITAVTVV